MIDFRPLAESLVAMLDGIEDLETKVERIMIVLRGVESEARISCQSVLFEAAAQAAEKMRTGQGRD